MKEFERVQVESRTELRAWLQANHTRAESIWIAETVRLAQHNLRANHQEARAFDRNQLRRQTDS